MILLMVESDSSTGRLLSITVLLAAAAESGTDLLSLRQNKLFFYLSFLFFIKRFIYFILPMRCDTWWSSV